MVASELEKEPPLKITFFKVNINISVCVKFQYLNIQDSVLETEHTPRLMLMSRVQFLSLNHYFYQRTKF